MDHCMRHSYYHEDCAHCRNVRGRDETINSSDDSPSMLNTVVAAEIIAAETSTGYSDSTSDTGSSDSGFSDSTNSGGDSGGGGASGDW